MIKIIFFRNIFLIEFIIILILLALYIIKNGFFKKSIIKQLKVCLCVLAKRENLYAKEFVNHYKEIGYNHIFIYDNNDIDGERFEDVIQDEIKSNFVTIINLRGKLAPHEYSFIHCYRENNKTYDWLSFFDFDEFLEIKPPAKNVQELLGNPRYDKCATVKFNFLFYSDNELLYYDPRPLKERFTTALYSHPNNKVIKTTVRGRLPSNYWEAGFTPHTSHMNVTSCNCRGEILPPDGWLTPFE